MSKDLQQPEEVELSQLFRVIGRMFENSLLNQLKSYFYHLYG